MENTDFTPITTQEQLNAVISARLARERETVSKKYADYDDLKKSSADQASQIESLTKDLEDASRKITGFETQVGELNAKIKTYETASVKARVAQEAGLPYEMASRLSGETEEELREDAKVLASYMGSTQQLPPLKDTEPAVPADSTMAAYLQLAKSIKGV